MRKPVMLIASALLLTLLVVLAASCIADAEGAHPTLRNGYHPFTVETSVRDK